MVELIVAETPCVPGLHRTSVPAMGRRNILPSCVCPKELSNNVLMHLSLVGSVVASCRFFSGRRWPATLRSRREVRRRRAAVSSTLPCAGIGSSDLAQSWHCAQSSSPDIDHAIAEVLSEWRASFGRPTVPALGTPASDDTNAVAEEPPVPFSDVQQAWHDWRAGACGPVALVDVVRSRCSANEGLREAFELFPDNGADLLYPAWRTSLRWERPGRPPPDELWKAGMRRGAVAAELRRTAIALRKERQRKHVQQSPISFSESQSATAGFALVFVPLGWAGQLAEIARQLELAIAWPDGLPFVAVLSQDGPLYLGTAIFPSCRKPPPRAFFLSPREFEEAGAEGYRLQEQLDIGNQAYTEYWRKHGRLNGTVVACRMMFDRKAEDVGSIIIFADPAAATEFPRQGLGLLDAAYPKAVKAGLVAGASEKYPGRSIYIGGRSGGLRLGGLAGILLPGGADSAVGLCGCEAVGPLWEVFEADAGPGMSIIRTVADPTSAEYDDDGRRRGVPAGTAFQELASEQDDVWVGIPRGGKRATRLAAPGVGEFALFRGKQTLANGSLLLEGPGPGAEGVAALGKLKAQAITRAQCFKTIADERVLGQLHTALTMERLVGSSTSEAYVDRQTPYATLVFGGGSGPQASILDKRLHGGVFLGLGVLGSPGNTLMRQDCSEGIAESDNPQPPHSTLIHRQAAALFVLYAA